MNVAILDDVRAIASDVLGVEEQELNAQSSPATISTWDSVQQLYLILALEERFSMQFEPNDIEGAHSLGDIAHVVQSKIGV